MELIPKADIAEALRISVAAALQKATPPRLTPSEHSAIVSLHTVALILGLETEADITGQLLAADTLACREHRAEALKSYQAMDPLEMREQKNEA